MKMIAYITKLNVYSFILNMKDSENYNTLVTSVFHSHFFKLPDTRRSLRDTTGDSIILCLLYRCRCRTY